MRGSERIGDFWRPDECLPGWKRTGVDYLNGLGREIFTPRRRRILLRAEDDFLAQGLGGWRYV